jgi:uncharacterized protein
MKGALIVVVAVLLTVVLLAWSFQRRLIYFPLGNSRPPLPPEVTGIEEVTLRTDDGLELRAWHVAAPDPDAITVLVCNGNAGNRGDRLGFAIALRRLGAQALLLDYRGFGSNPGSPSHAGLIADARAALSYLVDARNVNPARIVYFGESLGAAVAAELAVVRPPAALILRSPFTSLADVGQHHYPFLPVRWILRDPLSVVDHVRRVKVRTLVIAGDRDRVVPIEQSRRVFEAAAGPKELVIVPGADHNDHALFTGETMMRAIHRLIGQ